MNKPDRLTYMLVAASLSLLAFCCVQPVTVAAQSLPPPLPLPDITVYGTVTSNGEALTTGAVKALLPNGVALSAPIGPINGTAYNYALMIPLFMTATTTLSVAGAGAQTGDVIAFFVDNRPAFYRDPATELTMSELAILAQGTAKTAAGRSYAIDLTTAGAEYYPMGDVNATGVRNSADAMLALKYDIGLILGVTTFPPGPNTVYLPLCDIVENGRCDSSDALRILQCDAGISGVTCPTDRIPARTRGEQAPAAAALVTLHTATVPGPDADLIEVQVLINDQSGLFGAATLELDYDRSQFAVDDCVDNPIGALDLVSCNAVYAPGVVRFNGITAAGSVDAAPLVTVRFRQLGETTADLNTLFALRAAGVFDQAGADLAWSKGSEAPPPSAAAFHVFMPAVASQLAHADVLSLDETDAPPLDALGSMVHLPMIGANSNGATQVSATPPPKGAATVVISTTEVITATEAVTDTEWITGTEIVTETVGITGTGVVTETQVVTETADPGHAIDPAPTEESGDSLPASTLAPVADLPPKDEPDGTEDGQRLYLPWITEE